RADGVLEFVGRLDGQVKIRGFRVEVGEVEAALEEEASVRQAVVVAREHEVGGKRLVAYVVGEESRAGEVKEHLRRRLPEYMLPSLYVYVEKLPLNPNGKVDRKALPAPEVASERGYIAPRTPLETLVAGIWSELLDVPQVGIQDNFFELGGHSLLAAQVISRLQHALQVSLPVRCLFERPTLAEFTSVVETQASEKQSTQPEIAASAGGEREVPLSFAQERLWFLHQLQPGSAAYNVPTAVRLEGPLDVPALQRVLEGLIRRHEALRTTFRFSGTRPVQHVSPASRFHL